ncbi:type II secretion system F family protein [Hungatella effluvii]|uniref:type II secretion system F family protein n=1 Tax=Hungatella effluvii TaxID=1096246 RepID=UPI0022E1B797|nr:type II secretion system F family protein [Hungatella effluvii]
MAAVISMGVSGAVCAVFVGLFLLCYLKSKGRYDEYMEYVDKEEYGLKDFIPLGLWLREIRVLEGKTPMMMRTFLARYGNGVYQKVLELHGPKNVEFYCYIHNGYRLATALICSAGASIIGVIMSAQGDVSNGLLFSGLAAAAFSGVPFLVDSGLNEQIEKRRRSIQMEFPEFINKLTLLVNAGMTISKAWEKIINENKKDHILYDEMRYALMEIKAGKPEGVAYEEFARRCRVKEVTKFVSVIVMNLKRGGSEVVPVLREQGNECWEMRKNAARQMGEEAGTKILIPMMIMFLGIVLVVSTPAVLSMTAGM